MTLAPSCRKVQGQWSKTSRHRSELVCVCVNSHIRQSELFLNFRAFRRSPRVQNSLPIGSCPRLRVHPIPCQCLPVAYPPSHPPTAPTLARNFAAVRRVPIPDSLVTYRIASRNSIISCASDHNCGVCLNRPSCVMLHTNVSHFLKRRFQPNAGPRPSG